MRRALLAWVIAILSIALPLAPADAVGRAQIYVVPSACDEGEALKPEEIWLGCQGAGLHPAYTEEIVYRHYGAPIATATATFHTCLTSRPGAPVGPYQGWHYCPEGPQAGEYTYHGSKGLLRFSHIVRCHSLASAGRSRSRLFYTEMSYTYAGKPWTVVTSLQAGSGDSGWACPGGPHEPPPSIPAAVRSSLLARAQAVAEGVGDPHPSDIAVVLTSHRLAERLQGYESERPPPSTPVYLLAMRGHFGCGVCSVPPGAKAPTGTVVTLEIIASTMEADDSGLGSQYPWLRAAGSPVRLD